MDHSQMAPAAIKCPTPQSIFKNQAVALSTAATTTQPTTTTFSTPRPTYNGGPGSTPPTGVRGPALGRRGNPNWQFSPGGRTAGQTISGGETFAGYGTPNNGPYPSERDPPDMLGGKLKTMQPPRMMGGLGDRREEHSFKVHGH